MSKVLTPCETGSEPPVTFPFSDLSTESRPIIEESAGARIRGSECVACGQRMVGRRFVCSRCASTEIKICRLASSGVLYAFTQIHVGVLAGRWLGYVDLADGTRILANVEPAGIPLACDATVHLHTSEDGWFFSPQQPVQSTAERAEA